ncbi:hypothetical protein BDR05DRAFT_1004419 [Suillus weaverae]|nr:hypothetical protein BDR05DRAFT_1004419 [Suillus weaverae]
MMMMEQTASNDLESLFSIVVKFVTTYDGPQAKIIHPKTEQWADLLEDIGSRTVPYKSGLLLVKRDMELMNCTTAYFGELKQLVQEWCLVFIQATEEPHKSNVTHNDIEGVLMKWISHEAANEPPLVPQSSSLNPTDVLAHSVLHRSNRKTFQVERL